MGRRCYQFTVGMRWCCERPQVIFVIMAGALPLPLTWVADFLYRPLVIAGVVMSDQESGLWSLLAQRQEIWRGHVRRRRRSFWWISLIGLHSDGISRLDVSLSFAHNGMKVGSVRY